MFIRPRQPAHARRKSAQDEPKRQDNERRSEHGGDKASSNRDGDGIAIWRVPTEFERALEVLGHGEDSAPPETNDERTGRPSAQRLPPKHSNENVGAQGDIPIRPTYRR